ncbi:N5-glutamine S-adenosyl-L-methionine-dependent methyltransferase [compost metagenome]
MRVLVDEARRVLVPGGWLVMEIGAGQATAVAAQAGANYARVEVVADYAGIDRVIAAQRG